MRVQSAMEWSVVESEDGYDYQSNIANEFRALCGLSPTLFLQHGIAQSSKTCH
jgi:hypothetical protein